MIHFKDKFEKRLGSMAFPFSQSGHRREVCAKPTFKQVVYTSEPSGVAGSATPGIFLLNRPMRQAASRYQRFRQAVRPGQCGREMPRDHAPNNPN